MRIIAHLLSVILLLPGLTMAAAFLLLDHLAGQPGWVEFLTALLEIALILLPWGLLGVITALFLLSALGFSDRWRWAAAMIVGLIVAASTTVLLALGNGVPRLEQSGFFVPGAVAFVIAAWIAITEWPKRPP